MKSCRAEFPSENAFELRDLLIDLTGRSMSTGHSKVILRSYLLPNLTAIVPLLINLLTPISGPADFDEEEFELAAEALEEIMSRSALAGGTGTKTLTEPLLLWFERHGGTIVENTLKEGFADSVSRSLCKLLTALGDHSPEYLAANLASSVSPSPVLQEPISTPLPPKSHLIQTFLRLLLAFTALPGYYGVDEEESEMTLGFWYLFQEALWSTDPEYNEDDEAPPRAQGEQGNISRAVYSELVQALRRKVVWPEKNILQPWARDQRDKFQAYRRDVGDTLVNAYYILRDDMLAYYVSELIERISSHREAFGELHAGLVGINDTEKSKVLQSIASVIQALPPEEEIPPVEAIVSPVVSKLYELLQSPAQLPEETRALVVQQLQTIAGVARGLTRTNDSLLIFDDSPDMKQETERMRRARQDPRVVRLRDAILDATRRTVDLWCTDASVSDALSELCKAITSLPSDDTLLSLPAGPLLELICLASQRQLTAVWLNLATMLIIQMDPPALFPTTFKSVPSPEARGTVLNAVTALLQSSLNMFGQPGAMVDVCFGPDPAAHIQETDLSE
ncbi:hypothetical protein EW026_g7050 [Hermanssonia centrifuga]|uniref:Uncharacterized protein n=1 Tax=Hermanssonia centrifuga TaxID=98765 RepID=A0A4S4K929_9APHY|nr:hypothetical protein EW026_g7050 [Hermanssonia centrifuga]